MIAPHLHLQQAHITQTLEETNTYGIAYRDTKGPLSLTQLPEPQLLPKLKTIHPQPTTSALGLGRKIRRRLRTAGKSGYDGVTCHARHKARIGGGKSGLVDVIRNRFYAQFLGGAGGLPTVK